MALINLKTALSDARAKKYAVGSFNVIDLNFLEAIFAAAVAEQSPVIISIAEVHLPFVTLEHICPAIHKMAEIYNIPVVLNFDHGMTMDAITRAIDNGFSSIMFDGSKLSLEDNIEQTAQVVEICHKLDISVEAELGAVGGAEGGELTGEVDPNKYTDITQAKRFVEETGIDALAVAIGNSHGKYKGEPELDFELLESISKICDIPLVLHGGSGISDDDFRKAISLGINKINFFTGMSQVALKTTETFMNSNLGQYNDYPFLMEKVKLNVAECVKEQIRIFGSSNQA